MKFSLLFLTFFSLLYFEGLAKSTNFTLQKVAGQTSNSDSIRVIQISSKQQSKTLLPLYYLNDSIISQQVFSTLNTSLVTNVYIQSKDTSINGISYKGAIYVTSLNHYTPKIISLTELKKKYVSLTAKSSIFTVDGILITSDYDDYLLDEKNILKLLVDTFTNAKEGIDAVVVNVLTKTPENLKKDSQIMLR